MRPFVATLLSGLLLFLPLSISGIELFANLLLLTFIGIATNSLHKGQFKQFLSKSSLSLGNKPLLGFLAIGVLGAVSLAVRQSVDSESLKNVTEVLRGMRWVLFLYAFTFLLRWIFEDKEPFNTRLLLQKPLLWFAILNLLMAALSVWQMLTGGDIQSILFGRKPEIIHQVGAFYRAAGFFGMPLTFAYSQGLFAFVFLGLSTWRFKNHLTQVSTQEHSSIHLNWSDGLILLAGLGCSISVFASGTRGAWLAWVAAVGIVAIPLGQALLHTKGRLWLGAVLAGGLGLLGTLLAASESIRLRIVSIVDFSQHELRMNMWQVNWSIFKDYPLLGVGFDQNSKIPLMTEYYDKLEILNRQFSHAHNNYLHILSGMGALGFAFYLAVCGWFLWLSLKIFRDSRSPELVRGLALGALAAQVYLHVGGLTECNFRDQEVNFAIVTLWSLLALFQKQEIKL